jgi:anti-sigma-K factor RskA
MTMNQTPHGEFEDALGAYAIGALDADEKRVFEAHLATCESCQTELRSMRRVVAGIGLATEPVQPPDSLKARVIAHATSQPQPGIPGADPRSERKPATPDAPGRRRSWAASPLALAASLALATGAGIYALALRSQVLLLQDMVAQASAQSASLRDLLNEARRDAASLRTTIRVLVAPDLIRVDLKGQADAPNALARGFWSKAQGLVFNAEGLPAIDVSRVYQLWMISGDKAVSGGTFSVDASGAGTLTVPASVANTAPDALAVSLERAGGVASREGPIVLLGAAPR